MYSYTIPVAFGSLPVGQLLRRLKFSLTLRRRLRRTPNTLFLNGQPAAWQGIARAGDVLGIVWPQNCTVLPLPLPLAISYEDEFLLVVDKPAGLLVHPTSGPLEPTLANAVVHHLQDNQTGSRFHPVHRLDRNTSGLILIAKNPYVHNLLFADNGKQICRTYLAVVVGTIHPPTGEIDAPIGRHPDSIIQRIVRPDGQSALTYYETVRALVDHSLVKLRLATGRTHQIRVHLAAIGHPLVGDDLYGGPTSRLQRQALHAAELAFSHPMTGEKLTVTSPLLPDIRALLDNLDG